MTFKPRIWYPIAVVLSALNVGAVWFAAVAAEPLHSTVHAALGVGFALWANTMRLRRRRAEEDQLEQRDPLALEVNDLRQELSEAQERLDFAERMLAQERNPRRPEQ